MFLKVPVYLFTFCYKGWKLQEYCGYANMLDCLFFIFLWDTNYKYANAFNEIFDSVSNCSFLGVLTWVTRLGVTVTFVFSIILSFYYVTKSRTTIKEVNNICLTNRHISHSFVLFNTPHSWILYDINSEIFHSLTLCFMSPIVQKIQ